MNDVAFVQIRQRIAHLAQNTNLVFDAQAVFVHPVA